MFRLKNGKAHRIRCTTKQYQNLCFPTNQGDCKGVMVWGTLAMVGTRRLIKLDAKITG